MPKSGKTRPFSIGKVPPASLLRAVYPYLGLKTPRLIIGPGIGRDVAAIRYGEKVLVFSTDPVTGTETHIGRHSLHINANDIATSGAVPKWYFCTILLPPGTSEGALRRMMIDMDEAAKALKIAVLGGHTEVTKGLKHPIIAGFMVGETTRPRLLTSDYAQEGDEILMTKTAGLEGTAIIATDHPNLLKRVDQKIVRKARQFSAQISIVKEALAVARIDGVHAMHDPTEGGVLNGIWEIGEASKLGVEAYAHKISVTSEAKTICRMLRLNPLKLMSSGALLIAANPARGDGVRLALNRIKVRVAKVGRLVSASQGRRVLVDGKWQALEPVSKDELYTID